MSYQININHCPGRYGLHSPVTGKRAEELKAVQLILQKSSLLEEFEKALHGEKGSISHLFIIPYDKRLEADVLAKDLFVRYIAPYKKEGITEKNAVDWVEHKYWSIRYDNAAPGLSIIKQKDLRGGVPAWHSHVVVDQEGTYADNGYLPPHIVAYHEFQHVEETSKGISTEEYEKSGKGVELVPSLQTLLLLDSIYKQIAGKKEEESIDYGKSFKIGECSLPIGKVANFYRKLSVTLGSLSKAVISDESLKFLGGE